MENKNTKRGRRYYNEEEIIWIVDSQREGKVLSIDKENHSVMIEVLAKGNEVGEPVVRELKLWEIDKLKYLPKKKLEKKNQYSDKGLENLLSDVDKLLNPTVYFARLNDSVKVPSKRDEDAGFDIFPNFEGNSISCPKGETTLIPTGLAVALPETHYLNAKHERGSTGKLSISILAGVVDSGYRGEIFIAVHPLEKGIIITKDTDEVEVSDLAIAYPYKNAICQATVDLVPSTKLVELTFEDLQKIESERGTDKLGSTNK